MRQRRQEFVLAPVGLLQSFLDALALIDVDDDGNPSIRLSLSIEGRRVDRADPAWPKPFEVNPLLVTDFSPLKNFVDVRANGGQGLHSDDFLDRAADDLLGRFPEPLRIVLAHPEIAKIAAAARDWGRHRVGHDLQLAFRRVQRLLSALAFADLPRNL